MSEAEPALAAFIQREGLAARDETGRWTPLTGGVSSDIWRVETSLGTFCVKRALAKLKVAADWEAPVDRNAFEWAYMATAGTIAPGSVPQPIAHDPAGGLFAMAWLAPDRHLLWKSALLAGRADPIFAGAVGDLIGRIHAATARDPAVPARFASDANFHALRIEPYLLATAARHPDLASRIDAIARTTASTRQVLVHGDVSPKNILIGPNGPVLLDAEVAWFGDPAFDVAFCLNHLVIKAAVVTGTHDALVDSAAAFVSAYFAHVDWESAATVETRAARLLPALALARVDGKSPVDYLDDDQRGRLRSAACAAILAPSDSLGAVIAALSAR